MLYDASVVLNALSNVKVRNRYVITKVINLSPTSGGRRVGVHSKSCRIKAMQQHASPACPLSGDTHGLARYSLFSVNLDSELEYLAKLNQPVDPASVCSV